MEHCADFDIDMSFSAKDIVGMLSEYEADHNTGMCIERVAEVIYEYTSGYPYLVSRICMLLDEQITDYPELEKMLYAILFYGQSFAYNPDNYVIDVWEMTRKTVMKGVHGCVTVPLPGKEGIAVLAKCVSTAHSNTIDEKTGN